MINPEITLKLQPYYQIKKNAIVANDSIQNNGVV